MGGFEEELQGMGLNRQKVSKGNAWNAYSRQLWLAMMSQRMSA
jgi:hypothetical protein